MKIYDCQQGDQQWTDLRLFTPTASNFHKILTPKKWEFSASAKPYAFRLVAQKLLNRTLESLEGLEHVERGKMDEPKARKAYEFKNDVLTKQVGFITTDDGKIGCSPDSLVGTVGLAEIKCPAPEIMVKYHMNGEILGNDSEPYSSFDDAYICQKQGQMLIAEREWNDLYAFSYEFPDLQKRFNRNEKFLSALGKALREFNDMKDHMLSKMEASGYFAEKRESIGIAEAAYQDNLEAMIGATA
jgi:hypothetical protein